MNYLPAVSRSSEVATSVEPTADSGSMEEQGVTGQSLEAEPPLVSSHGTSFWMFIVVCLS